MVKQNPIRPRKVALAVPNVSHFVPCVRVTGDFLSVRGFVFETETSAAPGARDLAQALVSTPVQDVPEVRHPAWQVRFRGDDLDPRLAGRALRYVGGARLDFAHRAYGDPGMRATTSLCLLNLDKFDEITGCFRFAHPETPGLPAGGYYLQAAAAESTIVQVRLPWASSGIGDGHIRLYTGDHGIVLGDHDAFEIYSGDAVEKEYYGPIRDKKACDGFPFLVFQDKSLAIPFSGYRRVSVALTDNTGAVFYAPEDVPVYVDADAGYLTRRKTVIKAGTYTISPSPNLRADQLRRGTTAEVKTGFRPGAVEATMPVKIT